MMTFFLIYVIIFLSNYALINTLLSPVIDSYSIMSSFSSLSGKFIHVVLYQCVCLFALPCSIPLHKNSKLVASVCGWWILNFSLVLGHCKQYFYQHSLSVSWYTYAFVFVYVQVKFPAQSLVDNVKSFCDLYSHQQS